jgi:hypothetical protein
LACESACDVIGCRARGKGRIRQANDPLPSAAVQVGVVDEITTNVKGAISHQ